MTQTASAKRLNRLTTMGLGGFTIVELLIVIVVIAILATISVLAYNGVIDKADKSVVSTIQNQVPKNSEIRKITEGAYPETVDGCIRTVMNVAQDLATCVHESGRLKWTYSNNSYRTNNSGINPYTDIITPGQELTVRSGKHFAYMQTAEYVPKMGWATRLLNMEHLLQDSGMRLIIVEFDARTESGNPLTTLIKFDGGKYKVNESNSISVDIAGQYKSHKIEITPELGNYPTGSALLTFNHGGIQVKNLKIYSK